MITIKYFGPNNNAIPKIFEFTEGLMIANVVESLENPLSKTLTRSLNELTFMVNKTKADETTLLHDGDELYIFNPVIGG